MNEETFKKARMVNEIVESLMSKKVEDEYLQMYLNDSELRKECDKAISSIIEEEILNYNYISNACLNYLNNAVKPKLKEKPYLINMNIVTIAIENYLDKISDGYTYTPRKEFDEKLYNARFESAKKVLNKIDNDFVFNNIDVDAEERFANIYINRMKNNNPLSQEQVEELVSFALMGGFILKHEEYTDKALGNALKNIICNNYKIDEYLYKKLFIHSCNNILRERNIEDLNIEFRNQENVMSYSNGSKTVFINRKIFTSREPLQNFMTFFHELRHYEQYNGLIEEPLKRFLCYKDIFLSDELPYKDYYKKNYHNLFIEKDADYTSYRYVHDFVKDKVPSVLSKLKKDIYKDLRMTMFLEKDNINERRYKEDKKDINVLFEELVKNKKKTYDFYNKLISSPLLIEYDVLGNKRSVFELLESKDYNQKQGCKDRTEIINYLLYEESVSIDYIISNIKLFESEENENQYKKYYKEARKVIKHKLIRYAADTLSNKNYKSDKNGSFLYGFYEILIDKLREKNIRGLNKDKNIELYRKREEELRIAYKWVYYLYNEISEEEKQNIIEEITAKTK